jgi:hypothetical protein
VTIEEYKRDPCGSLSIPYWKNKIISVPDSIKIIHDSDFDSSLLADYSDTRYFRLKHDLRDIPKCSIGEYRLETVQPDSFGELAKMINASYTHSQIVVSEEDVKGWADSSVYRPELWIGAYDGNRLIGSIISEYDSEVGEGVIEWMQVLPEYRGKGIASALICKSLEIMSGFAEFTTVSGECDNPTNPEKSYRRCGFSGSDVWHILTSK